MAQSLLNTCEGTPGTTISTGNSAGPNPFTVVGLTGAGATSVYDTAHFHSGTTAIKNTLPASVASTANFNWSGTSINPTPVANSFARFYLYLTANPTVTLRLCAAINAAATQGTLQLASNGLVRVHNNAGTLLAATTTAIPLNQLVRVEWDLINNNGTTADHAARFFSGPNLEFYTPDAGGSISSTGAAVTALTGDVRFGASTSTTVTSNWDSWWDDIAWSDTASPGPQLLVPTRQSIILTPGRSPGIRSNRFRPSTMSAPLNVVQSTAISMDGTGALTLTGTGSPAAPVFINSVALDDASALTTRNITVPSGVTTAHMGIIMIGTASGAQPLPVISNWATVAGPTTATNETWSVFKRLGGHTASDTITINTTTTAETCGILAVWLDTGGKDIDVTGATTVRGSSVATNTAASITLSQDEMVLLISSERTTATGTTVTGVSPATPTLLAYHEGVTGANVSHYISYFDPGASGATAAQTITYSGASTNGGALQVSLIPNPTGSGAIDTIPSSITMAGTGDLAVSGSTAAGGASVTMAGTGSLAVAGLQTIPSTVTMAGAGAMGVIAQTPVSRFMAQSFMYVAHRGGSADWPEETAFAYMMSTSWNPDLALEISVWQSSDGVYVCSHDQTTGRVFGGTSLDIPTNTWATLSTKTTISGGLPICRIEDILNAWANGSRRVFFIDNKGQQNDTTLLNLLDTYGGKDRFIAKGFLTSTTWADDASARGYKGWGYGYHADVPNWSTYQSHWSMLGMDILAGTAAADVTATLAFGKPVLGHIISTATDGTNAVSYGVNGIMAAGVVEAVPQTATNSTVTMAGAGTLAVAGSDTISSTISMAGAGTLAVTPLETHTGVVGMAGSSTMAVAGSQTIPSTVSMAGAGVLSISTSGATQSASVAMAGTGTLAVSGFDTISGTVAMAGAGVLTVTPLITHSGVVLMVGSSSLAVTGQKTILSNVTMAGAGALLITAVIHTLIQAAVQMDGIGVLAIHGVTQPKVAPTTGWHDYFAGPGIPERIVTATPVQWHDYGKAIPDAT